MNANEIVWLICGVAAGYLAGTIATILLLRWRETRDLHPMQYTIPTNPAPAPALDWDTAMDELAAMEITPAPLIPAKPRPGPKPATTLEECPQCGKAYKRVAQHIAMSHPQTPARGPAASYPQRDESAPGGAHVDA